MEVVGSVVLTVAVNQTVKVIQRSEKYNNFKERAKRLLFRSHKNKSRKEDELDEQSWSLIENCVIDAITS
jgi:hypothetical protein